MGLDCAAANALLCWRMSGRLYLVLPLLAAVMYALSVACFKRAAAEGAGVARTSFVSNIMMCLIFLPMLAMGDKPIDWALVHQPIIVGLFFFSGQMVTFIAIRTGDVSLITPLLGTKVIFVAICAWLINRTELGVEMWIAAVLTWLAVIMLGMSDRKPGRRLSLTSFYALISALLFALCDSFFQEWADGIGGFPFIGLLFLTMGVSSVFLVPLFREPLNTLPKPAWKWIWIGGAFASLQALFMATAIGFFHDATGVNVIYSSRGLWALAVVWFVGHWFGNVEKHVTPPRAMLWRLGGTILTTIAILLTVFSKRG